MRIQPSPMLTPCSVISETRDFSADLFHWISNGLARKCKKSSNSPAARFRTVEAFAQGIIAVANAVMEKAIRVISVERGHDPRDYTLIAFGGAGGLHACELAAALEMRGVLIPVFPGGLSALGILQADVVKELSQTVLLPADELLQGIAAIPKPS